MYTTVQACHTHLRRTANLSLHQPLHTWYLITFALGLPVHCYAFVVIFVFVATSVLALAVFAVRHTASGVHPVAIAIPLVGG